MSDSAMQICVDSFGVIKNFETCDGNKNYET